MPSLTNLWRAAVCLLALSSATAAIEPRLDNFEMDEAGKAPSGWYLTTPAYQAIVTADGAKQGRQCVRIGPVEGAPKGQTAVLLRTADAKPYRGRKVRLRADLRIEPAGQNHRVQLWLRVDRSGGKTGFFDNMNDRPVRRRDWGEAEIAGDVDPDATVIVYGLLLYGSGVAWFDDVRLEDAGAAAVTPREPARPLAGRGLENLVAFTRLLGYVRHFHPGDEAAAADWDATAVAGVRAVESAASADELARRLEEVFHPLGPTLRVFPTGTATGVPAALSDPGGAKEVVAWEHRGYGGGTMAARSSVYSSRRERWKLADGKRPDAAPDPAAPFRADLGGGVSCLVPLALFADDEGTLPHAPNAQAAKPAGIRYSGDDRATRLAAVALGWNILQHFYPYFDVVGTDWPAALRAALASAAADPDEVAFLKTLRRMVAALNDGHGGVYPSGGGDPVGVPPLAWDWVEDKLVVTFVPAGNKAPGVKLGEIVPAIEGFRFDETVAKKGSHLAFSRPL